MLLFLLATAVFAAEPLASVDAVVAQALAQSPSVQAAEAQVQSLEYSERGSGAWRDPVLSVELSQLALDNPVLGGMGGLQFRVSQALPTSGRVGRERRLAEQNTQVGRVGVDGARAELTALVRLAWWELTRTRAHRELALRHVGLVDELRTAATSRYQVGQGGQSQLLRLQVLADRLAVAVNELDQRDEALVARLRAALGGVDASFNTPTQVVALPLEGDEATWIERVQTSPAVRAAQERSHALAASARLARSGGTPDLTIWAGYRVRTTATMNASDADMVSFGISAPIPVATGGKSARRSDAALAGSDAARLEARALVDMRQGAVRAELTGWALAVQQVGSYDDTLLPGGERTLVTALTEFRVGKAGFSTLYEAQLTLLDLERTRIDFAVASHLHRARLGELVGETQ